MPVENEHCSTGMVRTGNSLACRCINAWAWKDMPEEIWHGCRLIKSELFALSAGFGRLSCTCAAASSASWLIGERVRRISIGAVVHADVQPIDQLTAKPGGHP